MVSIAKLSESKITEKDKPLAMLVTDYLDCLNCSEKHILIVGLTIP